MKSITLKIAILFFAACTAFFTFSWFQRYRLPYNENGKYFDGVTVMDYDTVLVLAILAVGSFVATGVLSLLYFKLKKNKHN